MADQLDEFLDDFRLESHDSLDQIELQVLAMESGDPDAVNIVFRAMHSIKGGSSFLDLINVNRLSHQLENLLDLVRQGQLQATTELSDILLRGSDLLKEMIDSSDGGESTDVTAMLTEVSGFVEHGEPVVPAATAAVQEIVTPTSADVADSDAKLNTHVVDQSDSVTALLQASSLDEGKGPFGQFLVDQNYLTNEQVFEALIEQEKREMSDLDAFASLGISVTDCLKIANLARIHMLHPLRVAHELNLLGDVSLEEINRKVQQSRPPIGHILRELQFCDEVEARIWLQEYYDYCNDVETDPALKQQLQEHREQKAQQQVKTVETQHVSEEAAQEHISQSTKDSPAVSQTNGATISSAAQDMLMGSDIDCEDNLIVDYQDYVCEELRTEIENTMLGFEQNEGKEEFELEAELKNLFRTMHSLKGSVGFINADASQKVIHALEDTITLVQRSPLSVPLLTWQLFINASLKGIDIVWGLRDSIISERDERPFIESYIDEIEVFFEDLNAAKLQIASSIKAGVQNEDIDDLF